jgi:hypothetical protein
MFRDSMNPSDDREAHEVFTKVCQISNDRLPRHTDMIQNLAQALMRAHTGELRFDAFYHTTSLSVVIRSNYHSA